MGAVGDEVRVVQKDAHRTKKVRFVKKESSLADR